MLYFVVTIFFVLTYLILSLFLKLYYKTKIARYSLKSNYPTKIALFVLYGAFCLLNPSLAEIFFNWIVDFLNSKFDMGLTHVSQEINSATILLFIVLVCGVGYIINQTYKVRSSEFKKSELLKKKSKEKKEIKFPEEKSFESPHFSERIKKYFELKNKNYGLKLSLANKEKILFGRYIDGLRTNVIIISYSELESEDLIKDELLKIHSFKMKNFYKQYCDSENLKGNFIVDYHICYNRGFFERMLDDINLWTEEELINKLINFDGYLKKCIRSFKENKLFSAISKDQDKKSLYQTFIPPTYNLNEKYNFNREVSLESYIDGWLENSSDSKHLVLLGDYGMGKTTFLNYYCYTLASRILQQKKIDRFPVFITLTNCSPRHGGIDQRVKAFVAENLGVDYELFELLVLKGKILFLLDGFDEMGFVGSHDDRFKQMNEVWQLATKNNKLILSGRPSYFPSEFEMNQTLNIVDLDQQAVQVKPYCESIKLGELNDEQIREYISRYYPAKVDDYFDWLIENAGLFELCKRPSIMHIIREMLPKLTKQKSSMIYNQGGAIDMYMDYWINRQESKEIQTTFPISAEKVNFIKSFFRRLAVKMFIADQREINIDYVKETLKEVLDDNEKIEFEDKLSLEGFEHELFTGYFIEPRDGNFKFVHQSYFDCLVSTEIIGKLQNKNYNDLILYKDWSNTIVDFVYDHIDEEFKTNSSVPALMLLKNYKIFARFKIGLYKMFYKDIAEIEALIILTSFISLSIIYFKSIKLAWYWEVLIYLPVIVLILLITILFIVLFELIRKSRRVRFLEKAFKIGFIKGQLSIDKDLDFVLSLASFKNEPQIPFENRVFKNKNFKVDSFYRLKDIQFRKCNFSMDFISNCHFHNVLFDETKFNKLSFQHCRFTNIEFQNCTFNKTSNDLERSFILNGKSELEKVQMYFLDCKFDYASLKQLKILISQHNLELGKEVSGSKDFIELLLNIE